MRKAIVACIAAALVVGATSATAASLITSKDIKNRSIRGKDIAKGTIGPSNLSKGVRRQLAATGGALSQSPGAPGAAGPAGPQGAAGADGSDGADGARGPEGPVASSGFWGTIDRLTKGSPVSALRAGPATAASRPPLGTGSLSLLAGRQPAAADTTFPEIASYGNEVDFAGDAVVDLTAVGFDVWSGDQSNYIPTVAFEVDADGPERDGPAWTLSHNMSATVPAHQWQRVEATALSWHVDVPPEVVPQPRCAREACSFEQVKREAGRDATILSVAVRAFGHWQGAVDGLWINAELFDFEEHGVVVRAR